MFSSRRLSRPAQQPPAAPTSGALAAATVIGKALKENDHKPGPLNLPKQPQRNSQAHRAASLLGTTRASSITSNTSRPIVRSGSLRNIPSSPVAQTRPIRSSYAGPGRAQSLTGAGPRNQQPLRHQGSFNGPGAHYEGFDMESPAASAPPHMVKKWVPSAHGLVRIEVPADQPAQQSANARRIVARSASMNSLSSRARNQRLAAKSGPPLSQKKSVQGMYTQKTQMSAGPTIVEDETEDRKEAAEHNVPPQSDTIDVKLDPAETHDAPREETNDYSEDERELAEQKLEELVRQKEQEILQSVLQQQELEAAHSLVSVSNESVSIQNPLDTSSFSKASLSGSSNGYDEVALVDGYTGGFTENLDAKEHSGTTENADESLVTDASADRTFQESDTATSNTTQDMGQTMAQRLRPTLGFQRSSEEQISTAPQPASDPEIPARSSKRPSISKLEDIDGSLSATAERVPRPAAETQKRKSVLKNTNSSSRLSVNDVSVSSSAYLSLATAENTRLNAMASSSSLNLSQQPRASPSHKRAPQPERVTRQPPNEHKGMRLSLRSTQAAPPRGRRDSVGGLPSNSSTPAHLAAATRAAQHHNPQHFEPTQTAKKHEYKAAPKSEAQLRAAELYKKANERKSRRESILNVQYVQQVGVKLERTSSFEKNQEARRANRFTLRDEPAFASAQEQQQQAQTYQAPYKSRFDDYDSDAEEGNGQLNGKPSRNTLRSISAEQPRTQQQPAQQRFFSEQVAQGKAPEEKKKRFGKLRKLFGKNAKH
ncbi:hypothetical protein KL918_000191 [Ogataea parapolymorpha]|nr:hypothetical protein KL918_000191 [Ogataea parapolymorpha]KAG7873275.1 hypothetical protein KL916_002576 [Ogataea parapolymorpha]